MERSVMDILFLGLILAVVTFFLGLTCLYVDFFTWIISGERNFEKPRRISDKLMVVSAVVGIAYCYPDSHKSAPDWPVPVPSDWLSVVLLVLGCMLAYLYSTIRRRLGPALLEMAVNSFLLIAFLFTTMAAIRVDNPICLIFCIVPLYMVLIMTLADNYRLAKGGVRGVHVPP